MSRAAEYELSFRCARPAFGRSDSCNPGFVNQLT